MGDIDSTILANNLEHYISSFMGGPVPMQFKQTIVGVHDPRLNGLGIQFLTMRLPGNAFLLWKYTMLTFKRLHKNQFNYTKAWYCFGHLPKEQRSHMKYRVSMEKMFKEEQLSDGNISISFIKGCTNANGNRTFIGFDMDIAQDRCGSVLRWLAHHHAHRIFLKNHYNCLLNMIPGRKKKEKELTWAQKQRNFHVLMQESVHDGRESDASEDMSNIDLPCSGTNPCAELSNACINAIGHFFDSDPF